MFPIYCSGEKSDYFYFTMNNYKRLLFIFFGLSGFSGLIYESIWSRYLKLFLGHAAYAQVLVLAVFMGGMGVGAWLAGKYGVKIKKLILWYAIIEGIIGILALGFHAVFTVFLDFSYGTVIANIGSPLLIEVYKWISGLLLIFPQSLLLGATFPLLTTGIIRKFQPQKGNSIALLYFINSLGASIGVLVSGFYLIPQTGLPGTIFSAGIFNIIIAVFVIMISTRLSDIKDTLPESKAATPVSTNGKYVYLSFLLCATLTGTASFIYEIGWIRMLSLVLGSSTHSFEIMLSAFLLGLALGSYWIRTRADQYGNIIKMLITVQVFMAFFSVCSVISYNYSFNIMKFFMAALTPSDQGYLLFNVYSTWIAMLVMIPTTICAGMTLPLITTYLIKNGYGEKSVGYVYSVNTFGSIVGVIAGINLLPLLGLKNTILLGSGIDLLLGLFLFLYLADRRSFGILILFSYISVIVFFLGVLGLFQLDPIKIISGVFRHGNIHENRNVVFHKDGKTASVSVFDSFDPQTRKRFFRAIASNGKPDAALNLIDNTNSPDEPTMILVGLLPVAIHKNPKTAAIIGIGSGLSSHAMLTFPELERVDTIEIEKEMVEGARKFGDRVKNVFSDKRSTIFIEDAKTFFVRNRRKYDIITSEPSNPWVSGVSSLFSQEFYNRINKSLNPDGIFLEWIHLYELDLKILSSVIKALSSEFTDYALYIPNDGDLLIVATKSGKVPEPSDKIFNIPATAAELGKIQLKNIQDIQDRNVGNKDVIHPLFLLSDIRANSDYYPVVENLATKARFKKNEVNEFKELLTYKAPVMAILGNKTISYTHLSKTDRSFYFTQEAVEAEDIKRLYRQTLDLQKTNDNQVSTIRLRLVRALKKIKHLQYYDEIFYDWLPALHIFAEKTTPYVAPGELDFVWDDIRATEGYSSFPNIVHDWVDLYQAVTNRNFPVMKEKVRFMYKTEQDPLQRKYLAVIMIISLIHEKDYDQALKIFEQIPSSNYTDTIFDFLQATARYNLKK
jgi:predicted membrane-bound spermidine synthase